MRELTGHKVNPANDKLKIVTLDEPGAGGANHVYYITGMDLQRNSAALSASDPDEDGAAILFQCGPINENGVNGITQEALLEIVADRLRSFQAGAFACKENAEALHHVVQAQEALHSRTRARMARGVEGQSRA